MNGRSPPSWALLSGALPRLKWTAECMLEKPLSTCPCRGAVRPKHLTTTSLSSQQNHPPALQCPQGAPAHFAVLCLIADSGLRTVGRLLTSLPLSTVWSMMPVYRIAKSAPPMQCLSAWRRASAMAGPGVRRPVGIVKRCTARACRAERLCELRGLFGDRCQVIFQQMPLVVRVRGVGEVRRAAIRVLWGRVRRAAGLRVHNLVLGLPGIPRACWKSAHKLRGRSQGGAGSLLGRPQWCALPGDRPQKRFPCNYITNGKRAPMICPEFGGVCAVL